MYSWWWVRLSPETCRVKANAKNKNAIVASCWTYFTYYKAWCTEPQILNYEILFTLCSYLLLMHRYPHKHISDSALLETTSPKWLFFDIAIYQSFRTLPLIDTALCTVLLHNSAKTIIVVMYLSWSWATCWPVPVSRMQKSLQSSAMIPSASRVVVFHYPG